MGLSLRHERLRNHEVAVFTSTVRAYPGAAFTSRTFDHDA